MKTRLLLFLLLASLSCERYDPGSADAVSGSEVSPVVYHDAIVLGEKLEDPFTVENMTKALASVYPTKADRTVIEPTDFYVRFLPADMSQYEILESMGVRMTDHPLDYSIVREGDWYHDPTVPDSLMTWQYAVVPVDFGFPSGIRCELLDRCYLPERDASTKGSGIDWEAVEYESYRLTGNADALLPQTRGTSGTVPSGRISIVDPLRDSEPEGVAGVMVCCNSFVRISTCYTDDGGYYEMDRSFSASPRYRLVFKNSCGFGIGMNLILVPASVSTLGRHSPEGLDVVISSDSDGALFRRCAVNNAAYDYFTLCSKSGHSLSAPPSNLRMWLFPGMKLSLAAFFQQGAFLDGSIIGDYLGQYLTIVKMFLPDLIVGLAGTDGYDGIYAETVRNLAQASHFTQVGLEWWERMLAYELRSFVSSSFSGFYGSGSGDGADRCELAQMWAWYMQTSLYRERYSERQDALFGTGYWFCPQIFLYMEERGLSRGRIFSGLSEDVVDTEILLDRLLALYPESKSVIQQAFIRYGRL